MPPAAEHRADMRSPSILIVDPDADRARALGDDLVMDGYEVEVTVRGETVLDRGSETNWDLLVIDPGLPDVDGLQLIGSLRRRGDELPVLIVTDRGEEAQKVLAFRTGADDYVTRPFGVLEFLARVDALLRRSRVSRRGPDRTGWAGNGSGTSWDSPAGRKVIRFGDVEVDPAARRVLRDGGPVSLTPKETDLLFLLLRREGRAVSRDILLDEVWNGEVSSKSRTVDTHISELRRKLEPEPSNPRHLITVRKVGYRFQR